MRKQIFKMATLAVALAVFSSHAAMGQQKSDEKTDWMKDFTSRITFNGYAQGGYSWQDANSKNRNDFNLKRTLLWAKARITDRWSFLFMHDFSSVVQEFYTDYRLSNDKSLTVRVGQFKHSYTLENPLSPTMLELIDVYSQAVLYLAGEGPDPLNGVNYGRDMGAMIYGDVLNGYLHYELALMNGQGINRRDGNNKKDVIARLDVRPIDGLRIVATAQKGTGNAVGTAAVPRRCSGAAGSDSFPAAVRKLSGSVRRTEPEPGKQSFSSTWYIPPIEVIYSYSCDLFRVIRIHRVVNPPVQAENLLAEPTQPLVFNIGFIRNAAFKCNTLVASAAIK